LTPRALVLGAAGQDGSYASELLVAKGYDVTGVVRSDPAERIPNLDGVRESMRLVQADLADLGRLAGVIDEAAPAEIYNFASVSFGPDAWRDPIGTAQLGAVAVCGLLEAIRASAGGARLFQASSAWVFGRPERSPQTESTPYGPVEPYGAAKAFADFLVGAYREHHGVFACAGILYNHESPRRSERFVTRKVTRTAAAIKLGLARELVLGNVDVARDWGYAKDVVEAAWLMLQAERPEDYVIATGESHAVRELLELAFGALDLDWEDYVRLDPALGRGAGELVGLVGDATAARERLGWAPSVTFPDLVELMVEADLAELSRLRT
jgi:GDPmannose 4,6-dehydratase